MLFHTLHLFVIFASSLSSDAQNKTDEKPSHDVEWFITKKSQNSSLKKESVNPNDDFNPFDISQDVSDGNTVIVDSLPSSEVLKILPWEDEEVPKVTNSKTQKPLSQKRPKRSLWSSTECEVETAINAYSKAFKLCLSKVSFKDEFILSKNFESIKIALYAEESVKRLKLSDLNLTHLQGFVVGEEFSAVVGIILNDLFFGSITISDVVYFVDPQIEQGRVAKQRFSKLNDIDSMNLGQMDFNFWDPLNLFRGFGKEEVIHQKTLEEIYMESRPIPVSDSIKVCDVAIVVDDLFFNDVGRGSVEETILQIMWIVKEANALLISKDFDDDGRSERIGINVDSIIVLTSDKSQRNILSRNHTTPEDFLRLFSRYKFGKVCLGMLFTNRLINERVLGLSWRGNPLVNGIGGICQKRALFKKDGQSYSFNTLFVTFRSLQQKRVTLRMSVLNLAHELLHSLGARHDPNDASCIPPDERKNGRYLMSRFSNNGRQLNHEKLSDCSKKSVKGVLTAQHRTTCLRNVSQPYCGDGIIDGNEECDCGTVFNCLYNKADCFPTTGGQFGRKCTHRKPTIYSKIIT